MNFIKKIIFIQNKETGKYEKNNFRVWLLTFIVMGLVLGLYMLSVGNKTVVKKQNSSVMKIFDDLTEVCFNKDINYENEKKSDNKINDNNFDDMGNGDFLFKEEVDEDNNESNKNTVTSAQNMVYVPKSQGSGLITMDTGVVNKSNQEVKSNKIIPLGVMFPVVLETAIQTNGFKSMVKAYLTEGTWVHGKRCLPYNTAFYGVIDGSAAHRDRVAITFNTIQLPNGITIPFKGIAYHREDDSYEDKSAGLKGILINPLDKKVMKRLGLSIIEGGMTLLESTQTNRITGVDEARRSGSNALLEGLRLTAKDEKSLIDEQLKSLKPFVYVQKGVEFYIMIESPVDIGRAISEESTFKITTTKREALWFD